MRQHSTHFSEQTNKQTRNISNALECKLPLERKQELWISCSCTLNTIKSKQVINDLFATFNASYSFVYTTSTFLRYSSHSVSAIRRLRSAEYYHLLSFNFSKKFNRYSPLVIVNFTVRKFSSEYQTVTSLLHSHCYSKSI